jgi:hypothetical protein
MAPIFAGDWRSLFLAIDNPQGFVENHIGEQKAKI